MNICYISYCPGAELRSALQEAGGKQKLLKGAAVATVGFAGPVAVGRLVPSWAATEAEAARLPEVMWQSLCG